MKRIAALAITTGLLAAPALAQDAGKAAPARPETRDAAKDMGDAYGDAARAMTDSMMKMMGAMFKMWNQASTPLWSSSSQMFGDYGEWCSSCHAQLSTIYDQLGDSFDPDVHKKLSDAELKKAAEAYRKAHAGKDTKK